MVKFLKWAVIALVVLFGGIFVVGLMLPAAYSVERTVSISAPPEKVHLMVGDLTQWQEWTPWLEADPTIETTFGETTSGVGASQTWEGESGSGELTFTSSDEQSGVAYDMAFDEGTYESVGTIRYTPSSEGTTVTWTMEGEMNGVAARYMGLAMNSMVGPMFEQGLTKLKARVEAMPDPELLVQEIDIVEDEPTE